MRTYGIGVYCLGCYECFDLYVVEKDYNDWVQGTHVQDAFPYLTEGERELLISRTCDDCFEEMFPEEEEEDEYWLPEDGSAIDPESDDVTYERDWYAD